MTSAVDTNVILDVLVPGSPFQLASQNALDDSLRNGTLIMGEVVYSELAAHFPNQGSLDTFLMDTGIQVVPTSREGLSRAGLAWREYRRRRPDHPACPQCGHGQRITCSSCQRAIPWRQHLITDFLVGGHASVQSDQLVTRDRGYYGKYFPDLTILDPGQE